MSSKKKPGYPYKGTNVSVEQSQTDINNLLRKYEVRGVQWTSLWDTEEIELKFPLEFEDEGVQKGIFVSLKPPSFYAEHRSYDPRKGYVTIKAPDYKASMRCLFFYIKAMLEAQKYGMARVEEVFMSHIMVSLPEGKSTTLGQIIKKRIAEGSLPQLAYQPP